MSTEITIEPGDTPLTITQKYIAARVKDKRETELVAMAYIVYIMTDDQAPKVYAELVDRPLLVAEADLAMLIAQRLGIEPRWMHVDLIPGATWERGRKNVE